MARRQKQTELKGFEQETIEEIEDLASKYDDKRDKVNGLQGDMENIDLKLRESMHASASKLEKNADGDLVYRRGDFNVVAKRGKERVNVKIKAASQGEPAEPEQAEL